MCDFDRNISVNNMQIQDKNSWDYGIFPSTLMECAGFSAAQTIRKIPVKKGDHVTIVCGTGNNGGDGFCYCTPFTCSSNKYKLDDFL